MKFLLTVLVIAAIWFLFFRGNRRAEKKVKKEGPMGRLGRAFDAARDAMSESAKSREEGGTPKTGDPVELKPCPKCGTYIAEGQKCACTP